MGRQVTLHYVYDPFCGWCYGAAPLLTAAADLGRLKVVAHSVGCSRGIRCE